MFSSLQCQVNAESGDPEDELTPEAIELCKKLGSNATRVSEIAGGRDRAVHAAIQEGINRVNEKATSNAQRIQKWIILDRDFSVSGGELGEWDGMRGCLYFAENTGDYYFIHVKHEIQMQSLMLDMPFMLTTLYLWVVSS